MQAQKKLSASQGESPAVVRAVKKAESGLFGELKQQGLNRLRKKRFCSHEEQQGLKPGVERKALAARLKPCPCYKATSD